MRIGSLFFSGLVQTTPLLLLSFFRKESKFFHTVLMAALLASGILAANAETTTSFTNASKKGALIMPSGYSRQLPIPFAADASHEDSKCVEHRMVQDDSGANTKVIIVARKPCTATLTFTDKTKTATYALNVTVVDSNVNKVIDSQMNDERGEGLSVKRFLVPLGTVAIAFKFQREVGPIWCADASVVRFERSKTDPRSLVVSGKKVGGTDLLVHDSSGKPIVKYYLDVKGFSIDPSWRKPVKTKEAQLEFVDL